MPSTKLIVDSGSTKAEWCLIIGDQKQFFVTQGLSPYFLSALQIEDVIQTEIAPKLAFVATDEIYYYGTGCATEANATIVKTALRNVFKKSAIYVDHDMMAAAKALCGSEKGIASILGTGSNCCYFDGNHIIKNSPGLGYVLGDEGSGSYLGKKVVQHYLYDIFDDDLRARFDAQFVTTGAEILHSVYKKPLPNRYLASFAIFLANNRGNLIIENMIEEGLRDFFIQHILRIEEHKKYPLHFVGSIAYGFKDVLKSICDGSNLTLGKVLKNTLEGLINYHTQEAQNITIKVS
ncbi:MAG: N-acetylglucosamine kinase [Ginsengibacter sp.]